MPCGNPNHEHPAWPQQGQHELLVEACENHCGWCEYKTKSANNLRVHAKRHVANKRETRLRRITIFKGKAGRKRVQMAQPRIPVPKAHEEKQFRSEAADRLRDPIQGHESESNNHREHEMNDPCFPSRSGNSLEDFFDISRSSRSVTPIFLASFDQRSDKANHPVPNLAWHGSERSNSNSKILFLPAYTQATQASNRSVEQDPGYKVTSTTNTIGARPRSASVDSENEARETCKPHAQDTYETYHGSSHVCPNPSERSRQTEYPDNHSSMDINQVTRQYFPSTGAQARFTEVQNSGSMPPDQSSSAPRSQAEVQPRPTTDDFIRDTFYSEMIFGSQVNPSIRQRAVNPQTVDCSQREEGSPNRSGSFSKSRLSSNESQDTNKQQSHNERRVKPRFTLIMWREIKLLEKPHLEEFKPLRQQFFDCIATSGSDAVYNVKCLRELEINLTTTALEMAKSDISYLSFSSALIRCIWKLSDLLREGDKTYPFGRGNSDCYFAEALVRIHEGVEHLSKNSTYPSPEKCYLCNHRDCPFGPLATKTGLNLPKRYYKVHLQYYHNEDVGFTEDEDIMGCSISYSYWFCSGCLSKVMTSTQACQTWVCPSCDHNCERNRIKARQNLNPIGGTFLDTIVPSHWKGPGPLARTTTMTDSLILGASDTTKQLLPAASTLPAVIAGSSRLLEASTPYGRLRRIGSVLS